MSNITLSEQQALNYSKQINDDLVGADLVGSNWTPTPYLSKPKEWTACAKSDAGIMIIMMNSTSEAFQKFCCLFSVDGYRYGDLDPFLYETPEEAYLSNIGKLQAHMKKLSVLLDLDDEFTREDKKLLPFEGVMSDFHKKINAPFKKKKGMLVDGL